MPNKGTSTNTLGLNGTLTLPSGYYDSIKVTQSITTKGDITPGKSIVQSGDKVWCRIPQGAYFTNAGSGYPEITYPQGDVASALGLTANKIVAGNTIGGIAGTATVQSLGGYGKITETQTTTKRGSFGITATKFNYILGYQVICHYSSGSTNTNLHGDRKNGERGNVERFGCSFRGANALTLYIERATSIEIQMYGINF